MHMVYVSEHEIEHANDTMILLFSVAVPKWLVYDS